MNTKKPFLQYAQIEWQQDTPFSLDFNDIYFCRQKGIEETDYTFIDGNNLIYRWKNLADNDSFSIAELGFGTGLNFLVTASQWQQYQQKNQTLHYIAIEKHPLSLHDLIKAHTLWPQFHSISMHLQKHYPIALEGIWSFTFSELNIHLTLIYRDVIDALKELSVHSTNIQAWYLDGFAPAKNKSIWQNQCFQLIAQHSSNTTTCATFTAAGFVRRGLENVGFHMQKQPGFGHKREMLTGKFIKNMNATPCSLNDLTYQEPWFRLSKKENSQLSKVAVIGAGIAGCTTAKALANTGIQVDIFESEAQVAHGASGVCSGIFYPSLSKDMNHASQFYYHAYHCLLHTIDNWQLQDFVHSTGLIKFGKQTDIEKVLECFSSHSDFQRWIHAYHIQKSDHNMTQNTIGIHLPNSGYIDCKALCQHLLQDSKIHTFISTPILKIEYKKNHWHLSSNNETFQNYDHLILCNSFSAKHLLPKHHLPAMKIRGQTLTLQEKLDSTYNNKVLCDDIYIIPNSEYSLHVGATFEQNNDNPTLCWDSQKKLLNKLNHFLDKEVKLPDCLTGYVGFRFASRDRFPFVGPLPDWENFLETYGTLWTGQCPQSFPSALYWPQLSINLAHGARGMTSAFICAQLLAAELTQSPITPLPYHLRKHLYPSRFMMKQLKKKKQHRQAIYQ